MKVCGGVRDARVHTMPEARQETERRPMSEQVRSSVWMRRVTSGQGRTRPCATDWSVRSDMIEGGLLIGGWPSA